MSAHAGGERAPRAVPSDWEVRSPAGCAPVLAAERIEPAELVVTLDGVRELGGELLVAASAFAVL